MTVPPPPAASWPMYQYTASHNAVFSQPGFRVRWEARLGDRINGGLAVVGGTVYAVSFDHRLYAIDEASGMIRWLATVDDVLMSTPVVDDGLVVIGSGGSGFLDPGDTGNQVWGRPDGNDLLAYESANGRLAWKFHTIGEDMPSPAIANGTVVFANGDLHAYGLSLENGAQRWKTPLLGIATMSSAAFAYGNVYVGDCRNYPYECETRAIDPKTGSTLWTNPNGGSDDSPAVDGGLVFVSGDHDTRTRYQDGGSNVVSAIDARSGKTRWQYAGPSGPYSYASSKERQTSATAVGGVLYQPFPNASEVVALDERTGRPVWKLRTWAQVKMSPVVTDSRVYFGDVSGLLYSVDRRTGRVVHVSSFAQPFSPAPPVIAGETLFVPAGSSVYAIPLDSI